MMALSLMLCQEDCKLLISPLTFRSEEMPVFFLKDQENSPHYFPVYLQRMNSARAFPVQTNLR